MLSGKAIFADEDVYAGYKKRRHADNLVRETLLPVGVPRGLVNVLAHALAFNPKKRILRVRRAVGPSCRARSTRYRGGLAHHDAGQAVTPSQPLTPSIPNTAIRRRAADADCRAPCQDVRRATA